MLDIEKLKRLRKEKKIKVKDMARMLGYESYQGYYKVEKGIRKISIEKLIKISQILGVDIKDLILEDKDD